MFNVDEQGCLCAVWATALAAASPVLVNTQVQIDSSKLCEFFIKSCVKFRTL